MIRAGSLLLLAAWGALAAADKPPVVTVAPTIGREISDYDFRATIEPGQSFEVRATSTGTVAKVDVADGTMVHKGERLLGMDTASLRKDLKTAEQQVGHYEKQTRELTEALDKAKKKPGTLSPAKLEKLAAERDVAAAYAGLARTTRDRIRQDLENAVVTAPVDGRVARLAVKAGDHVDAGTGFASLLCAIVTTDPVRATFDVDEASALRIEQALRQAKVKPRVQVGLESERGFPHRGTLSYVDAAVDRKTGRVHVVAMVSNADGKLTAEALAPGPNPDQPRVEAVQDDILSWLGLSSPEVKQGARIRLALDKPRRVLLVPESAVSADPQGDNYVLVVNDKNVVQAKKVRLGGLHGGLQGIESGLRPGDWVVIGMPRETAEIPQDQRMKLRPGTTGRDLRTLRLPPGTAVQPLRVKMPAPRE